MPTGHFQIGDLSFSFEGSFEELARVQSVMREFREAEDRLTEAADTDKVYLINDANIQGDRGTFDKLRLRTYGEDRIYSMDLGETDNNPLGYFPGLKDNKNIQVYERETEETWEITPDGTVVGKNGTGTRRDADGNGSSPSRKERGAGKAAGRERPQQRRKGHAGQQGSGPSRKRSQTPPTDSRESQDPNDRAATVLKQAEVHPDNQQVGNTEITTGPLADEVRWYAKSCNRGTEYMARVLDRFGADAVEELRIGDLRGAFLLLHSEERLRKAEGEAEKKTN